MTEKYLQQAVEAADTVALRLRDELHEASGMEALIVLPLIEDAARLKNRIQALRQALWGSQS